MNTGLTIALAILIVILLIWVNPSSMLNSPKSSMIHFVSAYVPKALPILNMIPSMGTKLDIVAQSGGLNSGVTTIATIGSKTYDGELNSRGTIVLDVTGDGTLVQLAKFDTCEPPKPAEVVTSLLKHLKTLPTGSVYRIVTVYDEGFAASRVEGNQALYDEITKILPDFNKLSWRGSYAAVFKFGKLIKSEVASGAVTIIVNA